MNKPQHKARKRFGQNFLIDESIIFQIIQSIMPMPGENLVEIGPGLGAMTRPLLNAAKKMTVIELDRDLIDYLRTLEGLTVINEDVLKVDLPKLCEKGEKLRIVGNLPYNISTPIIFHLLSNVEMVEDMHFMLQKEVIERMAAQPGDSAFSRLSIMVQRYCEVVPLLEIPPESFDPAPKVMSQFVRLIPYEGNPYGIEDDALFFEVVKDAFSMKRKMLRNNLKSLLSEEEILNLGIDPKIRAENLHIEDFVKLSNYLAKRA
ncbi:16S rRNA (adenine(1518)-N(6)/adenine(1519)-N(6))-dimethyltransferase RsmA [Ignatzschineria rhizosphaerae]|uniref:Ribosomal RNA small subunit methyltransferase A n=1 Tax=Ignatzschineria rhizosphaerae TaxID=2923279 RepID=A0ABY3WZD6_9GAMM|nr:16S rRNA (adenine(1518)-N(6)/adenine(1519)-N(6))-dimethyltransferase RsmA [Ignatzschineria rhizosphaerae]UNM95983.1 16S rRNA (adenine(1518)-N(6)/adenine(1519)-N(6))-dimethyltransferase RsmA [Ignatzschineria rhizosphaerae]